MVVSHAGGDKARVCYTRRAVLSHVSSSLRQRWARDVMNHHRGVFIDCSCHDSGYAAAEGDTPGFAAITFNSWVKLGCDLCKVIAWALRYVAGEFGRLGRDAAGRARCSSEVRSVTVLLRTAPGRRECGGVRLEPVMGEITYHRP
jgi:hypothetical protein